jgi:hypothetical protein
LSEIGGATLVALSDVDHSVQLTREQWAVACRINGPTYARELARACGITLPDAIERLRGLMAAGLCVTVSVPTTREPEADILRQVLNGLKNLS